MKSPRRRRLEKAAGGVIVALGFLLLPPGAGAANYALENDPHQLESDAKYNYYLGQYYFTQGKFENAQQYFQRSRDLMERHHEILQSQPSETIELPYGMHPPAHTTGGGKIGPEYLVSDGDILYISVWQNDDLRQEVVVRPDGHISFPLIGDVPAAGRTLTQIDEEVTRRLKEFVKFPEVSISIRRFGGSKVIVMGEVMRPGVYAVSGERSILEAIALAGGFTNDAVANSVILVRGGLRDPKAQRLNLRRALIGKAPDANVVLKAEDIIYVPRTFIANVAYIMTQIIDPVERGAITATSFQTLSGRTASQ